MNLKFLPYSFIYLATQIKAPVTRLWVTTRCLGYSGLSIRRSAGPLADIFPAHVCCGCGTEHEPVG